MTVKIRKDEKDKHKENNKKFIRKIFNKILGKKKIIVLDYPAISDGEKTEKLRKFIESKVSLCSYLQKKSPMDHKIL
ncbi:unnamed protein product [Meloidogyne enterolobii]|uniref:Uncharacterized protein n=1 Tax=Meloidogyne enterolobii TaxID=390850 RepID=A0ACB1B6X1_MELEN